MRLGRVLGVRAVATLCGTLEQWAQSRGPAGDYGILQNNVWRTLPAFAALVERGGLAAVACHLLRVPEVVLFQDNLVWKPPGARPIEWHQDYSYWPLDAPSGVTLWLALDDADRTNGCMHYLPGTHRLGERQPADFIAGTNQPRSGDLPPLDWRARAAEAVVAPASAGALLAHHPLVWHMSPGNSSTRPRRAFTMTWVTPDVHWDPAHAPHPYLHALSPARGAPIAGEGFPRFRM